LIGRRQLPVSSTITARSLVRAAAPALGAGADPRAALGAELRRAFGASAVALTDSGTSALVMALRATTAAGGIVALPAYACVDIGAAAIFASVRVMLYDVDPDTLSADLDSVARVLDRGATTVVVAHLYGYPANVPAVRTLADAHGAAVIEDAAQGAWGSLADSRLGAMGPLSVLSFGRGKGMTGSGGGALLGIGTHGAELLARASTPSGASRGVRALATAAAQWALGRPALYGVPSAIPALHLGETIYHPAHEPHAISAASASLVRDALARADLDLATRREHAEELERAAVRAEGMRRITPIAGSHPGYLRFPMRLDGAHEVAPALGVVRGYPSTLAGLAELAPTLIGDEKLSGARELQRSLVTLPTHALLTAEDLRKIIAWMVD
jgi:dTDP-4-amino-4,6-dideoxygalactose transaminase